ncbi:LysM peptidoglycan-binding domain-containing protein [Peribacillus acanthi]|uniref:LysM peptidoglycan-binding domain-containing protein n=1 Tax=Peribacillus acanthi TaxID=2171554 RepID=UPI000D3E8CE8|nr:LysM domain-containing protein [Peribacillus acanthi]
MDSRKKFLTLIVIIIGLGTLGFGYAFWFHFLPLKERISSLSTTISAQEEKLDNVGTQGTEKKGEILTQTTELQKKLPVAPLVDQFILELERAEVESGSLITSFTFGQNQQIATETGETGSGMVSEIANSIVSVETNSTSEAANTNENGQPIESLPAVPLPDGVEQLTVSMTVESPSYFELEAFIKAIEDLPRITKIDNLTFTGQREVRESSVTVTKLTYSVTVSTFYFPKLEDLKSQVPKYEKPAPSEKINPLVPIEVTPSVDSADRQDVESEEENPSNDANEETVDNQDSEEEKHEYVMEEKNGKSYKVYEHKVESGDTFFNLAMKYYSDPEEQKTIKSWNGISRLMAGKTIEIPVLNN